MILGIQFLGVLFAVFMMYITFLHRKRNEFTLREAGFWIVFWIGFIIFILMPHAADYLIKDVLDFGRTFDFFIVGGFMFIIAAVFYTYTVLRKTQKKIDIVVRAVALRDAEKKQRK